jgi:hypothetical protein
MEQITAEQAQERAIKAADYLAQELETLNQKSSGPAPRSSPADMRPTFAAIFARLLSDRYVIVPPRE